MADVVPIRQSQPNCDLDAEASVLSAIIIDPARYDDVVSICGPDQCYADANKRIFEAIVELREVAVR